MAERFEFSTNKQDSPLMSNFTSIICSIIF